MRAALPSDGVTLCASSSLPEDEVLEAVEEEREEVEVVMEDVLLPEFVAEAEAAAPVVEEDESVSVAVLELSVPVEELSVAVAEAEEEESLALLGAALLSLSMTKGGV